MSQFIDDFGDYKSYQEVDFPPEGCPKCANEDVYDTEMGFCHNCGYDAIQDDPSLPEIREGEIEFSKEDMERSYAFARASDSILRLHVEPDYQPFHDLVKKLEKYPFFRLQACEDSAFNKWHGRSFKWLYKMDVSSIPKAIGPLVYLPKFMIGTKYGYRVLMHEAEHVKDFWKFGVLPFFLMQFLLPWGPSFKALFEYRGYVKSMQAEFDVYGSIPESDPERYAAALAGKAYTYCWPWQGIMTKWFQKARAKILSGKS
jgi:hypothetical protein